MGSTKRGHGEGTITLRRDGRWEARVSLPDGERKCLYGRTRAEAASKLRAFQRDTERGAPPLNERMTVQAYLEQWLASERSSLDYTSARNYEIWIRRRIAPHIGKIPLAKLTPFQLNQMYAILLAQGYARSTVRLTHTLLKQALNRAVKLEVLARNVALSATAPKAEPTTIVFLSREEAKRFLDAAKGTRLEAMWTLALSTGMRLGELLALEWGDLDVRRRTLTISKSLSRRPRKHGGLTVKNPKTSYSKRTIHLTATVIESLKRHKVRQSAERLAAGPLWIDHDVVFANEVGGHLVDACVRRDVFAPILKKAELPHMRPHDLRHTAATLLLEDGVNILTVSKMLGHSSVAFTLQLYGHVTAYMEQSASQAMERILFG